MSTPDPVPEEWRDIRGHEGRYMVSSLGRVKSLERTVHSRSGRSRIQRGRILKAPSTASGYPVVNLYGDGGVRTRYVHHLVAEAFIGVRPDGVEICHSNGDPSDARACNLRYATASENNMDKVSHGTHRRGERMYASVLTEHQVRVARARKSTGASSIYAMAREYGVNYGTLHSAVTGKSWVWLADAPPVAAIQTKKVEVP